MRKLGIGTLVNGVRLLLGLGSAMILLQAAPALVSAREGPAAPLPATEMAAAPTVAAAAPPPAISPAASSPPASPGPLITGMPTATAILSAVQVRRELDVPHWLRPGEYVWNPEGAPAEGPTIIVVNIRARVLSVYRAGFEIGRSSLIYGADNKPTPVGEFPILEKDADHVSNLYDAPMPHMMRLTWDGVALHGSPELRDDLATRGCVGLPREFAALLFDTAGIGDRVIIWDGVTSA